MNAQDYFHGWGNLPPQEVPRIWKRLSSYWKAALDEAWEAYKAGSVPIGAVIVDPQGSVVSRGRSRQFEKTGEPGTVYGNPLSHAELNALLTLDYARVQPRECVLYTTVEPCPLCMGAAYMAGIRRIRFASHDFWAGSANMLGSTPYLSMKPVNCLEPDDQELEDAMSSAWQMHGQMCGSSLRQPSGGPAFSAAKRRDRSL